MTIISRNKTNFNLSKQTSNKIWNRTTVANKYNYENITKWSLRCFTHTKPLAIILSARTFFGHLRILSIINSFPIKKFDSVFYVNPRPTSGEVIAS